MSKSNIKITNKQPGEQEDAIRIYSSTQDSKKGAIGKALRFFSERSLLVKILMGVGTLCVIILGVFLVWPSAEPTLEIPPETEVKAVVPVTPKETPIPPSDSKNKFYGFDQDQYEVIIHEVIQKGSTSAREVLAKQNLTPAQLNKLLSLVPDMNTFRNSPEGSKYALLKNPGGLDNEASYFIFEPDRSKYWIFGLQDSLYVEVAFRRREIKSQSLSTTITRSLKETIAKKRLMSDSLCLLLDSALAWTLDLYHLPENTKIKMLYDETRVDGKLVSVGPLHAVWVKTAQKSYYAFRFFHNYSWTYVDEKGRVLKNTFLKAPVNYSRISSRFGMREHPIADRRKFHYGTDYAAKAGSPIVAVADGVIDIAKHRKHNGYYVKIQHPSGFETLYLHMQKNSFPPKIRPGYKVRQGETIGLIGQTGDATGPHVCFHIRKDGKPIDSESVKLPSPVALRGLEKHEFSSIKETVMGNLDAISHIE